MATGRAIRCRPFCACEIVRSWHGIGDIWMPSLRGTDSNKETAAIVYSEMRTGRQDWPAFGLLAGYGVGDSEAVDRVDGVG